MSVAVASAPGLPTDGGLTWKDQPSTFDVARVPEGWTKDAWESFLPQLHDLAERFIKQQSARTSRQPEGTALSASPSATHGRDTATTALINPLTTASPTVPPTSASPTVALEQDQVLSGSPLNESWDGASVVTLGPKSEFAAGPKPLKSCLKKTGEASGKSVTWKPSLLDNEGDEDWYASRHPGEVAALQGDEGLGGWIRPQSNMGKAPMVSTEYAAQLRSEKAGEELMREYDFTHGPLVTPTSDYTLEDAFPLLALYGVDGKSMGGINTASKDVKDAWRDEQKMFRREKLVLASDDRFAHVANALTSAGAEASEEMDVGHWMNEYRMLEKTGSKVLFTNSQRSNLQSQLDTLPTTTARLRSKSEIARMQTIKSATTNKRSPHYIIDFDPFCPISTSEAADRNRFGLSSKAGKFTYDSGTHVRKMADGSYVGSMITPEALRLMGSTAADYEGLDAAIYYNAEGILTDAELDQYILDLARLKETKTTIIRTDKELTDHRKNIDLLKEAEVYLDKTGCTNPSCTKPWCMSTQAHRPSELLTTLIKARSQPSSGADPTKKVKKFNIGVEKWEEATENSLGADFPTHKGTRAQSAAFAEWLEGYNKRNG